MDEARRNKLREAARLLGRASNIVDDVADKEDDAMSNTPENLQGAERYSTMEEIVDLLNDASEKIGEATELVNSAAQKRCR